MTDMLVNQAALRAQVQQKYREVALKPDAPLHFHTGRALATRLDYPAAAVDPLPDTAVESFAVAAATHPVVAAVLVIGGLWMLYRTGLYAASMLHPGLLLLVHVHTSLAGWLFTNALVGPDPAPHRAGLSVRATVLVLTVAAHDILAKTLYAHPPAGVDPGRAAVGAQIMYYGAPPSRSLFSSSSVPNGSGGRTADRP